MALSSSSTLQNALDQYNDNLSWEGDAVKAAAALEAVRYILVNRPRIVATNDRNINFDSLAAEKERLEAYITATQAQSSRCSFTRGRMLL